MSELASSRNTLWRFIICALCIFFCYTSGKAQVIDFGFTHDAIPCGSSVVNFTATIPPLVKPSDCDFEWDFGDSKPIKTGQFVVNDFLLKPGELHAPFQVKLTIWRKSPLPRVQLFSTTNFVTVSTRPIPALRDVINPGSPFDNCGNATFQNPFYSVTVGNNTTNIGLISEYTIDWGDGDPIGTILPADFLSKTITHLYRRLGLFKLKFTALGQNGCSDTTVYNIKNQGTPKFGMNSISDPVGCAPVTFGFKVTGAYQNDPGTSYIWDFGDGSPTVNWTTDELIKNDSTVFHTYTKSSCGQGNDAFEVKLTAKNECRSAYFIFSPVMVGIKPQPAFTASHLCQGEIVQLINTTLPVMNYDCTHDVTYTWDFGDGSPTVIAYDTENIPHTFWGDNNEYLVKLSAKGKCQDVVTASQIITLIKSPVADATLTPLQGCLTPTVKTLTVNATNNSSGGTKPPLWEVFPRSGVSWGNNTGPGSINPQWNFSKKGNYFVTLTVENECAKVKKNFDIFVNGPIVVTFPDIPKQCNAYTFDAKMPGVFSLDTILNEHVKAKWQITPTGYTFLNGTTADSLYPQIRFDTEGDYTISVNLSNGCDSKIITKTFKFAFTPKAIAVPSVTEVCIPNNVNVHFDNQSTGYEPVYKWTVLPVAGAHFVNSTASSPSPDILFDQTQNYTVKLLVTNSCGKDSMSFSIRAKDKPTAILQPLPDICENGSITITSTNLNVIENNGGLPAYNWVVTPTTGVSFLSGSSSSPNPSYQFATQGSYKIELTVTNDCGSVITTQTLNVRPPVILNTVMVSPGIGCAQTPIVFLDSSTGDELTHLWTVLPDAGFSYFDPTLASPSILFNQAGTYTITHKLTGLCSIQSKDFTVEISTKPTFTLSPIEATCALPYTLNITSTYFTINQNSKTTATIHWRTDPSTGVTITNGDRIDPQIEFSKTGQYTVWVIAKNDCGIDSTSQVFRIFDHAVEKSESTNTIGCAPLTITFTDNSEGGPLEHTWSVSSLTGSAVPPDQTTASPDITFNKTGIFTVTHVIKNLCGTDTRTYTVKVKEPPTVLLSPLTNACDRFDFTANSTNMQVSTNQNDAISYLWTVTSNNPNNDQVVTFDPAAGNTSQYPVIHIADTGVFKINVSVSGDCTPTEASQSINITKRPEIELVQQPSDKCLPYDFTLAGTVYGQNLEYLWTISSSTDANFNSYTSTNARPQISFSSPGDYSVKLNVHNGCGDDSKTWNFTVINKPTILFNTPSDTCDNFTFRAERYVVYQDNGDAITKYNWLVFPNSGFDYLDGTSFSSPFPHIHFTTAGTYKLILEATNSCGKTADSRSFTIDQFIQVEAGADTTICTNNNLYLLTGTPAGGIWSILPASAANVLKVIGKTYSLDLNVTGNYSLTYKRGNSYCSSEDIRHFTILPLPVVDAGRDITICENDKTTYQLNGVPAGGTWSGSGLTGNTFSTTGLLTGSYILKYTWTDPVTLCSNTDQLIAKLLNVPLTGFTAPIQGCKNLPVLFTATGTPNTIYNWNFGDGQTVVSSGSINHTYQTGGNFSITMASADPNNCSISSSAKITILDDISLPIVTLNPSNGCAPLNVTFTVDTTGATGNGQIYKWNFGNGQTLNEAFTTKEVIYNQGIADTTYNATLTISNNCFSRSINYPIKVNASPNANFVMPHAWECSPIIVQFKNLTIDRNASFYWDFGDGTTSTDYQPTHSFTTGKVAKEFIIKLVAKNECGKDSINRPLLIKPNSIDAFIQINTRQACPGETVTFTNFSTDTIAQIMNYYWDFGDGTVSNTWNATHAYTTSGKYTVKLFVDNGCSYAEKSDQIEILPPLILSIASRDSICLGDSLNLVAFSNQVALINTKWDFGDNYFGTGTKTNHTYTTSGWKSIVFTAAAASGLTHCPGTAIKRVYVKNAPIPLPVKDIEGCAPISLSLKTSGQQDQLWNFGEDSVWSSSGNYTYTNTNSTPIRRKVSVLTENTLGCRVFSYFWVTVFPNPVAKIGIRSEEGSPEKVFLNSLSTNATACEWLFPDGTSSQGCDSILIRLYKNGFYKILLRSSNQYGCTDTTSVVHETLIKGLFVPNAFQPSNFSTDVNIFKPVGIGLKSYYLGIYDVWGNPIWETDKLIDTQPSEGWDGHNNKGKSLPMDVYIWRIKAVFIDGTFWKGMKGKDGILRTEGTITLIK